MKGLFTGYKFWVWRSQGKGSEQHFPVVLYKWKVSCHHSDEKSLEELRCVCAFQWVVFSRVLQW